MVEVKFTINGRPAKPGDLKNALEKATLQAVEQQVKAKLAKVTCAEHHQNPNHAKGSSLDKLTFEINGCCDALITEATKALS